MIKFNGNTILIVECDLTYAVQLKEILEERGAIVRSSQNLEEAQIQLQRSDFDMVICTHHLPDGSARDLVEWCKDTLSTMPIFAAIGNCTQIEIKQLQRMNVERFLSKSDPLKLIDDISRALFSFEDFKKDFLEAKTEKGISYEMKVAGKSIMVTALEILNKGVFLSFETPTSFGFGHQASLVMTCSDGIDIEPCSVSGVLLGEFKGGHFFKVNDNDLENWKKLISQIDEKQEEVTQFLKKASGK